MPTIHGQHHKKADADCCVCYQKTGRKGPDAVRRPCSRNYKTGGMCRQLGRSSNTDSQNTPAQHQLSSVTGRWTPQDRSTEWTA